MSDEARAIGFGHALLEQLRWFWHRLWLWIVIATVLTVAAAVLIISSMPDDAGPVAYVLLGGAFHPLLVLIALSWTLSAWRDDPPRDRQYFWLHPVERTAHTIARSLAGFIWLLLVVLIVLGTMFVMSRGMIPSELAGQATRIWLFSIAAVSLAYISASIAPVLSDRPLVWILLLAALVFIMSALANIPQMQWLNHVLEWLTKGPLSFGTALGAPGVEATRVMLENLPQGTSIDGVGIDRNADMRPGTALLLWLPVSTLLFLAAARFSRPR